MNAVLKERELHCWERILHTTMNREETLEMIVPDACADIQDIVDTQAQIQIQSKECGSGSLSLTGRALCTILYEPEGDGWVQRLRAELPFQLTAELEPVQQESCCLIRPHVSLAETRVMNPRKVLVRVELAIEVTAYQPVTLHCCEEIEDRKSLGIEVLRERCTGNFVRRVVERPFVCTEQLRLPGSRPPMAELLSERCRAFASESRLVGEKLIFKGGAMVELLYRTEEGELTTADFELPFSQIAEVGETGETTSFQLEVQVNSCQARAAEPDGRGVSAELELTAQVVLWEQVELSPITDAYSIHSTGEPDFARLPVPLLLDQDVRRLSVREVLELGEQVAQVCQVRVRALPTRLVGADLSVELRLSALCQTEDGRFRCAERSIQALCPAKVPGGADCLSFCTVPEADASVTGDGVELRLGLEFPTVITRQQNLQVLTAFTLNPEQTVTEGPRPSIVLRQLGDGERLWDIAKAYRTTAAEIEGANSLAGEQPRQGQMLLIPRTR